MSSSNFACSDSSRERHPFGGPGGAVVSRFRDFRVVTVGVADTLPDVEGTSASERPTNCSAALDRLSKAWD